MNISVVIIALNESDRISRCIATAMQVSDDVIVLDTGSTDDTTQVARREGAIVHKTEWKGYGATKNYGHSLAKNDWILSLDSDEWLSEELINELRNLKLASHHLYSVNRKNIYLGKTINYSGWSPDWVDRIFNKRKAQWNNNLVHERLEFPSNIKRVKLRSFLMHDSYRSEADHLEKIEKYARLKAETWVNKEKRPSLLKRTFGPEIKALEGYIFKLGILDGKAGLEIARKNWHLVKRQLHFYHQLSKK